MNTSRNTDCWKATTNKAWLHMPKAHMLKHICSVVPITVENISSSCRLFFHLHILQEIIGQQRDGYHCAFLCKKRGSDEKKKQFLFLLIHNICDFPVQLALFTCRFDFADAKIKCDVKIYHYQTLCISCFWHWSLTHQRVWIISCTSVNTLCYTYSIHQQDLHSSFAL